MDIFNQTLSAGGAIVKFLEACSAFSSNAKSLRTRLEWDLRVLANVQEYFHSRKLHNGDDGLAEYDQQLLDRTSSYLDCLAVKAQRSLRKMERNGFLGSTVNMALWVSRRSDIEEMEREIFHWTERFGSDLEQAQGAPPVVESSSRLQSFLALNTAAKEIRAGQLLLEAPGDLLYEIEAAGDVSTLPLQHNDEQLIFSSRKVPDDVLVGTPEFEAMQTEMGELSAALSCLNPAITDVSLLGVKYYFYDPRLHRFLFAHVSPDYIFSMMTLAKSIELDPFPAISYSLNHCFKISYKIAEAVFFLHTNAHQGEVLSRDDNDEVYLMGFDLIRGEEAATYQQGTFTRHKHPDRLQGAKSPRYIQSYDIYSLGVVLLEIGLWKPLKQVAHHLHKTNPAEWGRELMKITPDIGRRMGATYQGIVEWCLSVSRDQNITDADFAQAILDPLDSILSAL
ncbi:hypothetical protein T069G_10033 [Trichoderma breve]|uniref:Protein kinase domain-containing protein n=1 Tax=Trichoderma breve TaxID=2034170 RepID=A0A9W9BAA7_9HYPO|nr:hypothetical protein T069G_10033 [Trichoderma breve]KAJ4856665.1 hypothetical protein T069G_10033 [Trichoderma breve]